MWLQMTGALMKELYIIVKCEPKISGEFQLFWEVCSQLMSMLYLHLKLKIIAVYEY